MFTLVWLVVLLSCITLKQKGKSNVKSIYFQKIKVLKKKKSKCAQNTKNGPKLFLKIV
jgi:hypothetical protein